MKSICLIKSAVFAVLFVSSVSSFAQKSGVFKTFADYTTGKMEYGIDCATEKHKIRLNDFLGKDFITVVHEGKPYNLKKAEIWGYQLCDEYVVRFQSTEHFPLTDKGILWIYSKETVKAVSPRAGVKTITTFYFSRGGGDSILELTLINLKATFPENHKLHDAIDSQFRTDASLGEYDQFHKHYKINHFLESQSVK